MPQAVEQKTENSPLHIGAISAKNKFANQVKDSNAEAKTSPLNSVVSQLNELSQSFVDSFQDLEGKVQQLSGELKDESIEKENAIAEKERVLNEKAKISDRLQNLLSIMPAGVVVLDGNGRVKDCNAMAVDILGRPLMGELWVSVIKRAFEPQADDGHQISLKDGRKIHIETKGLNTEPGQLVVLTDMTKTRQLQAELSQQQKLSSMGKMVASLAHQIRTPLSAAILYGSQMNSKRVDDSLRQKLSDNLVERLHFMERQITDMLNFVKGERKVKRIEHLNDFCDAFTRLTSEFESSITISRDFKEDLFLVCDQEALLGSLINLAENAVQACRQKSTDASKHQIGVTFTAINESQKWKLQIVVSDNGIGISEAAINQIFEPFYTNKQNGNGLGLSIVHGTIIEHAGSIKVKSELGEFAEFTIELPLYEKEHLPKLVVEAQEVMNDC